MYQRLGVFGLDNKLGVPTNLVVILHDRFVNKLIRLSNVLQSLSTSGYNVPCSEYEYTGTSLFQLKLHVDRRVALRVVNRHNVVVFIQNTIEPHKVQIGLGGKITVNHTDVPFRNINRGVL